MKKLLTITTVLVIALVLCVLPVFAAEPVMDHSTENAKDDTGTNVYVADITDKDTLHTEDTKPDVTINVVPGDKNDKVTVTYNAADLRILADKGSRPVDAAWLGVRLMPKDDQYTHYKVSGSDTVKALGTPQCHNRFIPVNADILEEAIENGEVVDGKYVIFEKTFTWYKSDAGTDVDAPTTELTVILNVAKTTVHDKDNGEEVWDEEIYEAAVEANTPAEDEEEPAQSTTKEEAKKDETPKTGVVDYLPVLGMVAVVSLAGAVIFKRN